MPFTIIRNDITKVKADAIVNTANPKPVFGRGSDRAIYRAAGEEQLLKERRKIGEISVGEAAATKAFGLRAKYVIHTVGPVWQGGDQNETENLASCYRKSLFLALQLGCKSIAFPLISAGTYQFPKDKALEIALREIKNFLSEEEMDVTLVVFDRTAYEISRELSEGVASYIDEKTVERKRAEEYWEKPQDYSYSAPIGAAKESRPGANVYQESVSEDTGILPDLEEDSAPESPEAKPARAEIPKGASAGAAPAGAAPSATTRPSAAAPTMAGRPPATESTAAGRPSAAESFTAGRPSSTEPFAAARPPAAGVYAAKTSSAPKKASGKKERRLNELALQTQESFQESLLRKIDEKGLTDVEVYKKANIDRKLFSKIRSNPTYQPKKRTAIALAMALELNLDETIDLLGRAGLAFSPAFKADLIIRYCIEHRIFDLYTVNSILFDYDQPLLGA